MANFRHTAIGLSNGVTWSLSIYTTSGNTEAAGNAAWVTAFGNVWTQVTTYYGATTTVSSLFTATQSGTFHQLTKTSAASALAGTAASNVGLPLQISPRVTFTTASGAKGAHGGADMPPPVIAALAAAPGYLWLAAFSTALATGWQNARATLTGAGFVQILVSKRPLTNITVNGGYIGNLPKTQRRRYSKIVPTKTTFT